MGDLQKQGEREVLLDKESLQQDLEDENSLLGEVMEILLNTREQGQMMEQLIQNQIEVKDDMINKLHKELEYYKKETADKVIDQVMKALIKVRKDMKHHIESEQWENMTVKDLQREYTYIFEDMTDLLEQQNIDAFQTEEGENFNPSIHIAKLEKTNDASLDKKVKCSLDEGYLKKDKVLLPERVVVYHYNESRQ